MKFGHHIFHVRLVKKLSLEVRGFERDLLHFFVQQVDLDVEVRRKQIS